MSVADVSSKFTYRLVLPEPERPSVPDPWREACEPAQTDRLWRAAYWYRVGIYRAFYFATREEREAFIALWNVNGAHVRRSKRVQRAPLVRADGGAR